MAGLVSATGDPQRGCATSARAVRAWPGLAWLHVNRRAVRRRRRGASCWWKVTPSTAAKRRTTARCARNSRPLTPATCVPRWCDTAAASSFLAAGTPRRRGAGGAGGATCRRGPRPACSAPPAVVCRAPWWPPTRAQPVTARRVRPILTCCGDEPAHALLRDRPSTRAGRDAVPRPGTVAACWTTRTALPAALSNSATPAAPTRRRTRACPVLVHAGRTVGQRPRRGGAGQPVCGISWYRGRRGAVLPSPTCWRGGAGWWAKWRSPAARPPACPRPAVAVSVKGATRAPSMREGDSRVAVGGPERQRSALEAAEVSSGAPEAGPRRGAARRQLKLAGRLLHAARRRCPAARGPGGYRARWLC